MTEETVRGTVKRKRGRPRKGEIVEKKKPGKVGRPPGTAAIMNDYKARLLNSPKSEKVIQKIFDVALDDEHRHQAACMKLIVDRMLPVKNFEQEIEKSGSRGAITINIQGIGESVSIDGKEAKPEDDTVDAEWEEVNDA